VTLAIFYLIHLSVPGFDSDIFYHILGGILDVPHTIFENILFDPSIILPLKSLQNPLEKMEQFIFSHPFLSRQIQIHLEHPSGIFNAPILSFVALSQRFVLH
jgi:hypothetical protein